MKDIEKYTSYKLISENLTLLLQTAMTLIQERPNSIRISEYVCKALPLKSERSIRIEINKN